MNSFYHQGIDHSPSNLFTITYSLMVDPAGLEPTT